MFDNFKEIIKKTIDKTIDIKNLNPEKIPKRVKEIIRHLEPKFFPRENMLQEQRTLNELLLDYDSTMALEGKYLGNRETKSYQISEEIIKKIDWITQDAHIKFKEQQEEQQEIKPKYSFNNFTYHEIFTIAIDNYKSELEKETDAVAKEFIRRRIQDIQKIIDMKNKFEKNGDIYIYSESLHEKLNLIKD